MTTLRQTIANSLILGCMLAAPFTLSAEPRCMPMALPAASTGAPPDAYREFCTANASACSLTGDDTLVWSADMRVEFERINSQVNQAIEFSPDWEALGVQDQWDFPDCFGDCEDYALEKRRQLVEAGFPSAALTMAIAFHEVQFFPHAVLLAETTTGTWVLDNLYDEVLCWDAVPYVFTHRERPDGQWTRFRLP